MVGLLRRVVATSAVCCSLVSLTTSIAHTPSSARAPWRARPATVGQRTRSALNMVVDERSATSRSGGSAGVPGGVSAMSAQMKEMRADMEKDEKTALMMQALRGANINDDMSAVAGMEMRIVQTTDKGDALPLTYQPDALKTYFSKRPGAVIQRVFQVLSTSAGFVGSVLVDTVTGNTEDMEVRRAAELRDTITSLGPFFIKLGQALSIRPDVLSPRAMVELQQLCDKVPTFPSDIAMATIEKELGRPVDEIFSHIDAEPVAAASLGQVYKATLRDSGDTVAVKVQRPFVLETVSLDLHLVREMGYLIRKVDFLAQRLDVVELLDEFASRFYQELDYVLECENGVRIAEEMRVLPMVVIPKNYPAYTSRRVHVAQWIDGEKLSQSTADDVGALVNLGVITYLTQLLDTGFFHADPHPGNMLRTPDGKLVILDFGLMTEITDDQKYGMIEAVVHLINRDYSEIGDDFVNLDFIPRGTDTSPIVPALARVFDAALAGGGAKSINFQELAADLAEITFQFPFRIPPYFALVIRAIGVLEGIALVGNPEFAIVDEAYPYISRRLLTDKSPRMRDALKYMVYGKTGVLDVDRIIDLLQALEKFVAVKDYGDGSAFKVDGVRGSTNLGLGGDFVGTNKVDTSNAARGTGANAVGAAPSAEEAAALASSLAAATGAIPTTPGSTVVDTTIDDPSSLSSAEVAGGVREALRFIFSEDGEVFRDFLLDDIVSGADALSRDAARTLALSVGLNGGLVPGAFRALAPKLTDQDRLVVDNIQKLLNFLLNADSLGSEEAANGAGGATGLLDPLAAFRPAGSGSGGARSANLFGGAFGGAGGVGGGSGGGVGSAQQQAALAELAPVIREFAPSMRDFGRLIVGRLAEKLAARLVRYTATEVFGARDTVPKGGPQVTQQADGRLAANF